MGQTAELLSPDVLILNKTRGHYHLNVEYQGKTTQGEEVNLPPMRRGEDLN